MDRLLNKNLIKILAALLVLAVLLSCFIFGFSAIPFNSSDISNKNNNAESERLNLDYASDQVYDGDILSYSGSGNILDPESVNTYGTTGASEPVTGSIQGEKLDSSSNWGTTNFQEGKVYYLDSDIVYTYTPDSTYDFKRIFPNGAVLDGRGYTLTVNLSGDKKTLNGEKDSFGALFGRNVGTIKNLNIVINGGGTELFKLNTSKSYVNLNIGGVIGFNTGKIQNVTATVNDLSITVDQSIEGDITSDSCHVIRIGGFVAKNNGTNSLLNNVIFNAKGLSIQVMTGGTSGEVKNEDPTHISVGTFLGSNEGSAQKLIVKTEESELSIIYQAINKGGNANVYFGTVAESSGNFEKAYFNLINNAFSANLSCGFDGGTLYSTRGGLIFGNVKNNPLRDIQAIATSAILTFSHSLNGESKQSEQSAFIGGFMGLAEDNPMTFENILLSLNDCSITNDASNYSGGKHTGGFVGATAGDKTNTFKNITVIFSTLTGYTVNQISSSTRTLTSQGDVQEHKETYSLNQAKVFSGNSNNKNDSTINIIAPVTGYINSGVTENTAGYKRYLTVGNGRVMVGVDGNNQFASLKTDNVDNLYKDDSGNYGFYRTELFSETFIDEYYTMGTKCKEITLKANVNSTSSSRFTYSFSGNKISTVKYQVQDNDATNTLPFLVVFYKTKIYTAADFNNVSFSHSLGAGYLSGDDFNIQLMDDIAFESRLYPLGNIYVPFRREFNGNNHTITIKDNAVIYEQFYAGVFGVIANRNIISNGNIRNLKIVNNGIIAAVGINGNLESVFAGALCGKITKGNVQNVDIVNGENSYIASANNFTYFPDGQSLLNVKANCKTVIASSGVGGAVGCVDRATFNGTDSVGDVAFQNCSAKSAGTLYSYSAVNMMLYMGGFVGYVGKYSNYYTFTEINVEVNKFVKKFDYIGMASSNIKLDGNYEFTGSDSNTKYQVLAYMNCYIGGFVGLADRVSKSDWSVPSKFYTCSVIFTSLNAFNGLDTTGYYYSTEIAWGASTNANKYTVADYSAHEVLSYFGSIARDESTGTFTQDAPKVLYNCLVVHEDFVTNDINNSAQYAKTYYNGASDVYFIAGILDRTNGAAKQNDSYIINNGSSYDEYVQEVIVKGSDISLGLMNKFEVTNLEHQDKGATITLEFSNSSRYATYQSTTLSDNKIPTASTVANKLVIKQSESTSLSAHDKVLLCFFNVKSTDIANLSDFTNIRSAVNSGVAFKNTVINLRADIDMSTFSQTIGNASLFNKNFSGTFNGNGYKLYMQNKTGNIKSLFSSLTDGGKLINLNIEYSASANNGYTFIDGIAISTIGQNCSAENVKVTVSNGISRFSSSGGGICNTNNGNIKNCLFKYETNETNNIVQSGGYFGGIVNINNGTVVGSAVEINRNLFANGSGSESSYNGCGGIVGKNNGKLYNNVIKLSGTSLDADKLGNVICGVANGQSANNWVYVNNGLIPANIKISGGKTNVDSLKKATIIKVYGQGTSYENIGALTYTIDTNGQIEFAAKENVKDSNNYDIPFYGYVDLASGVNYSRNLTLSSWKDTVGIDSFLFDGATIAAYYIDTSIDDINDFSSYIEIVKNDSIYKGVEFSLSDNLDVDLSGDAFKNKLSSNSGFLAAQSSSQLFSVLNGNGHTLKFNLSELSESSVEYKSIFNTIAFSGGVKNINIEYDGTELSQNSDFYGVAYENNGVLQNVRVTYKSSIDLTGENVFAGLLYMNKGEVNDCRVEIIPVSGGVAGKIKASNISGLVYFNNENGIIKGTNSSDHTSVFMLGAGAFMIPKNVSSCISGLVFNNAGRIYDTASYVYGNVGDINMNYYSSNVGFSGGVFNNLASGDISYSQFIYNADLTLYSIYDFGGIAVNSSGRLGGYGDNNKINSVIFTGKDVYDDNLTVYNIFGGAVALNFDSGSIAFTYVTLARKIYANRINGGLVAVQASGASISDSKVTVASDKGIFSNGNNYTSSPGINVNVTNGAVGGLIGAGYANINRSSVTVNGNVKNNFHSGGFAAGAIGYRVGGTINGLIVILNGNYIAASNFAAISYDTSTYLSYNVWLVKNNSLIINTSNLAQSPYNVYSIAGVGSISAEFSQSNQIQVNVTVTSAEIDFPFYDSAKVYNRSTGVSYNSENSNLTYSYTLNSSLTSADLYLAQFDSEIESYEEFRNVALLFNNSNVKYLYNIWINLKENLSITSSAEFLPLGNPNFGVTDVYGNSYIGFNSYFDGEGHSFTVEKNVDFSADYAGFFGYVGSKAVIYNLIGYIDGKICGINYAGGLAAYLGGRAVNVAIIVRNGVKADAGVQADDYKGSITVTSSAGKVGGISGEVKETLENVWLIAKNSAFASANERNYGLNTINILGYQVQNLKAELTGTGFKFTFDATTWYENRISGDGEEKSEFTPLTSDKSGEYFAVYINRLITNDNDFTEFVKYSHDFDLSGVTIAIANYITNDITVSSMNKPIGYAAEGGINVFSGTFDGNGKIISINCQYNESIQYSGLFGYLSSSACVKNLNIYVSSNSYVSISSNAMFFGILAGYSEGEIENIAVDCRKTLSISSANANASIGGIAGYQKYGDKISNVWFKYEGAERNIFAFSENSGADVMNKAHTIFVIKALNSGLIFALRIDVNGKSAQIFYNFNGSGTGISKPSENQYNNDIKNKVSYITAGGTYQVISNTNSESYTFTEATSGGTNYIVYANFIINSLGMLKSLSDNINNHPNIYNIPNMIYQQSKDITIDSAMQSIGRDDFAATYNGNGKTITVKSGLASEKTYAGLFGKLTGKVKNLIVKFEQGNLGNNEKNQFTGAFAGYISGSTENVVLHFNNSVLSGSTVGRFAGAADINAIFTNTYMIAKNSANQKALSIEDERINLILVAGNFLANIKSEIGFIGSNNYQVRIENGLNKILYVNYKNNVLIENILQTSGNVDDKWILDSTNLTDNKIYITDFSLKITSEAEFKNSIAAVNDLSRSGTYNKDLYYGITLHLDYNVEIENDTGFEKFDIVLDGQGNTLTLKNIGSGVFIEDISSRGAIRNVIIKLKGTLGSVNAENASLIKAFAGSITNTVIEIEEEFDLITKKDGKKDLIAVNTGNYSLNNVWVFMRSSNPVTFTKLYNLNVFTSVATDGILNYSFENYIMTFTANIIKGYSMNWFSDYGEKINLSGVISDNATQKYISSLADKNLNLSFIGLSLEISTKQHLIELSNAVSAGFNLIGMSFSLISDINLSDSQYSSAGDLFNGFSGTLDGNNYALTLKNGVPLFEKVESDGVLKNIKGQIASDSNFSLDYDYAPIVLFNYGMLKNISVTVKGDFTFNKFGGIVLTNEGNCIDCDFVLESEKTLAAFELGGLAHTSSDGKIQGAKIKIYGTIKSNGANSNLALLVFKNTGAISNAEIDIYGTVIGEHDYTVIAGAVYTESAYTKPVSGIIISFMEGGTLKLNEDINGTVAGAIAYNHGTGSSIAVLGLTEENIKAQNGTVIYTLNGTASSDVWAVLNENVNLSINNSNTSILRVIGSGSINAQYSDNKLSFTASEKNFKGYYSNLGQSDAKKIQSERIISTYSFSSIKIVYAVFIKTNIENFEDYLYFNKAINGNVFCGVEEITFNLAASITVSPSQMDLLSPINTDNNFTFNFDGKNNVIIFSASGLNGSNNSYAGMFGFLAQGITVSDLTINITSEIGNQNINFAGGLAAMNYGTVDNVTVNIEGGSIRAANTAAGLVGINYGTIKHSTVNINQSASIFSSNTAGGLVGINRSENGGVIDNCSVIVSDSHLTGQIICGGAVGSSENGAIKNCNVTFNNSSINSNSQSSRIGGFIGKNNSTTDNSLENITTTLNSVNFNISNALAGEFCYAGGFAGENSGKIKKVIVYFNSADFYIYGVKINEIENFNYKNHFSIFAGLVTGNITANSCWGVSLNSSKYMNGVSGINFIVVDTDLVNSNISLTEAGTGDDVELKINYSAKDDSKLFAIYKNGVFDNDNTDNDKNNKVYSISKNSDGTVIKIRYSSAIKEKDDFKVLNDVTGTATIELDCDIKLSDTQLGYRINNNVTLDGKGKIISFENNVSGKSLFNVLGTVKNLIIIDNGGIKVNSSNSGTLIVAVYSNFQTNGLFNASNSQDSKLIYTGNGEVTDTVKTIKIYNGVFNDLSITFNSDIEVNGKDNEKYCYSFNENGVNCIAFINKIIDNGNAAQNFEFIAKIAGIYGLNFNDQEFTITGEVTLTDPQKISNFSGTIKGSINSKLTISLTSDKDSFIGNLSESGKIKNIKLAVSGNNKFTGGLIAENNGTIDSIYLIPNSPNSAPFIFVGRNEGLISYVVCQDNGDSDIKLAQTNNGVVSYCYLITTSSDKSIINFKRLYLKNSSLTDFEFSVIDEVVSVKSKEASNYVYAQSDISENPVNAIAKNIVLNNLGEINGFYDNVVIRIFNYVTIGSESDYKNFVAFMKEDGIKTVDASDVEINISSNFTLTLSDNQEELEKYTLRYFNGKLYGNRHVITVNSTASDDVYRNFVLNSNNAYVYDLLLSFGSNNVKYGSTNRNYNVWAISYYGGDNPIIAMDKINIVYCKTNNDYELKVTEDGSFNISVEKKSGGSDTNFNNLLYRFVEYSDVDALGNTVGNAYYTQTYRTLKESDVYSTSTFKFVLETQGRDNILVNSVEDIKIFIQSGLESADSGKSAVLVLQKDIICNEEINLELKNKDSSLNLNQKVLTVSNRFFKTLGGAIKNGTVRLNKNMTNTFIENLGFSDNLDNRGVFENVLFDLSECPTGSYIVKSSSDPGSQQRFYNCYILGCGIGDNVEESLSNYKFTNKSYDDINKEDGNVISGIYVKVADSKDVRGMKARLLQIDGNHVIQIDLKPGYAISLHESSSGKGTLTDSGSLSKLVTVGSKATIRLDLIKNFAVTVKFTNVGGNEISGDGLATQYFSIGTNGTIYFTSSTEGGSNNNTVIVPVIDGYIFLGYKFYISNSNDVPEYESNYYYNYQKTITADTEVWAVYQYIGAKNKYYEYDGIERGIYIDNSCGKIEETEVLAASSVGADRADKGAYLFEVKVQANNDKYKPAIYLGGIKSGTSYEETTFNLLDATISIHNKLTFEIVGNNGLFTNNKFIKNVTDSGYEFTININSGVGGDSVKIGTKTITVYVTRARLEINVGLSEKVNKEYDGNNFVKADGKLTFEAVNKNVLKDSGYTLTIGSALKATNSDEILVYSSKLVGENMSISFSTDRGGLELVDALKDNYFVVFHIKKDTNGDITKKVIEVSTNRNYEYEYGSTQNISEATDSYLQAIKSKLVNASESVVGEITLRGENGTIYSGSQINTLNAGNYSFLSDDITIFNGNGIDITSCYEITKPESFTFDMKVNKKTIIFNNYVISSVDTLNYIYGDLVTSENKWKNSVIQEMENYLPENSLVGDDKLNNIVFNAIKLQDINQKDVFGLVSPTQGNECFFASINNSLINNYTFKPNVTETLEDIVIAKVTVGKKTINFGITQIYGSNNYLDDLTIKYTEKLPKIADWSNSVSGGEYYIELLENNNLVVNTHVLKAVLNSPSGIENPQVLDYVFGNYNYSFKVYDKNGNEITNYYDLKIKGGANGTNDISDFTLTVEKSQIEVKIAEKDAKDYNVTVGYNTVPEYELFINGIKNTAFTLKDFFETDILINGTSDYSSINVKWGIEAIDPLANIYKLTLGAWKNDNVKNSFFTEDDNVTNELIESFNASDYNAKLVKALLTIDFDDITVTYYDEIPTPTYRINGKNKVLSDLPGISSSELSRIAFSISDDLLPGKYDINFDTEIYLTNYNLKLNAGTLTINKWRIEVEVDDITVTYKTQPKFSARYKNLPDISKESLVLMKITEKAVMSIVEDNNLGEHPITWRMYDKELNSKYEFVITKQGICNITAASIVVKILGASKVKGSADPKLYYEIVEGKEFLNETSIKGELVRVEGEGSGKYLICADNLDAGEKFVIVIDNSDGDNYLYIKPNYLNVTLTIIASILGGCGIVILCAVCYFIKRKRRRDFLNN